MRECFCSALRSVDENDRDHHCIYQIRTELALTFYQIQAGVDFVDILVRNCVIENQIHI